MLKANRRQVLAGIVLAAVIAALILTLVPDPKREAQAQGPLPPNQPERGLVYDGLEVVSRGVCAGAFRIKGTNTCTHGPDPAPLGLSAGVSSPLPTALDAPAAVCDGDGTTGKRIQVVYAHSGASRYSTLLGTLRTLANQADQIFQDSAAETGGTRHLRFVTDGACNISVADVQLSAAGDDSLGNTENELGQKGYSRTDRKYLVFVDAPGPYCGIADIAPYDSPLASNPNNFGPMYARVDNGCWSDGTVAAHEIMHNLGGVQRSAPHATTNFHCYDEGDRMCYPDGSGVAMRSVCASWHDRLFDCNHDDYFHTNPPLGSYLATHWNSANNEFLIASCLAKPKLGTPTNLAGVTHGQILLDWANANCARMYRVQVKMDGTTSAYPTVSKASGLTSSQYLTGILAAGHWYYWRVFACDGTSCRHSVWWKFFAN